VSFGSLYSRQERDRQNKRPARQGGALVAQKRDLSEKNVVFGIAEGHNIPII